MKHIHLISAVFIVLFFLSCGEKNKKVVISYPNGQPKKLEYYHYEGNTRKVDKIVYYYKEGNIESEIEMQDSKKHGEVIYYYRNGKEHLVEHYKNGRLNGKSTEYYIDGTVNYEAHYKNGVPHGTWIYYNDKGNETSRQTFNHGKLIE
jgi:antitoxin component YwqK of YwqJK toxin-antitoxin module